MVDDEPETSWEAAHQRHFMEIFRAYAKQMFGKKVLRFRLDTGVHTSTTPSWDLIKAYEYHVRKEVVRLSNEDRVTLVQAMRTAIADHAHYLRHFFCPIGATARQVTAPQTPSPLSLDSGTRQIADLKRQLTARQQGGDDKRWKRGKGRGKGADNNKDGKGGKNDQKRLTFSAFYKLFKLGADAERLCYKFQEAKYEAHPYPFKHACALYGGPSGFNACNCDKFIFQ